MIVLDLLFPYMVGFFLKLICCFIIIEDYRHADCTLLVIKTEIYEICNSAKKLASKVSIAKIKCLRIPAKPKAPVSLTSPDNMKLTLQDQRLKCEQLQRKIMT